MDPKKLAELAEAVGKASLEHDSAGHAAMEQDARARMAWEAVDQAADRLNAARGALFAYAAEAGK